MSRVRYIVNPKANNSDGERISKFLQNLGLDVRVSSSLENATQLTREAVNGGFKIIIAVGGDGVVNAVVNGLAPEFSSFLGIIPVGSGNDFAKGLGYHKFGTTAYISAYCASLEQSRVLTVRTVDLIRVDFAGQTVYGTNQFTFGFSGIVAHEVAKLQKRTQGVYVRTALRSAWNAAATQIDGYYRGEVFDVYITNGKTLAGGIKIAPQADLRDGKIEGLIIPNKARPVRYFLIGLGKLGLIRSRLAKMLGIRAFQIEDSVSFVTTEKLFAQLDGEPFTLPIGDFKVAVSPRALGVITPE
ncbi:MAG: hypothetical protein A2Z11_01520 [Candidatus Woykebacteria bacterium RBG_16_43_9]|uniref:DAGKc domain-containing protein n=1 Tax=Candidatus Woykebacteria bacterium RBG_16_43_9 TaxID=1802596 RepID=A0A1G1WGK1_9BACT|nr:MAG: hypothetical protein A2Z11_01520 [Candidatus Woykebacteria bacterium RBG_16_43_9]